MNDTRPQWQTSHGTLRAIAMVEAGASKSEAARQCGISYNTLYRALRRRREQRSRRTFVWNGHKYSERDLLMAIREALHNTLKKHGLDTVHDEDGDVLIVRIEIRL